MSLLSSTSNNPDIQIRTGLASTTTYLEERSPQDCSSGIISSSTAPSSAAKRKRHPSNDVMDTDVDAKLPKLESRDLPGSSQPDRANDSGLIQPTPSKRSASPHPQASGVGVLLCKTESPGFGQKTECEREVLKEFANAQYQPQPSFNIAANTYHISSDDSFTSTDVESESEIQAKVERLAREYKSLQAERKIASFTSRPTAPSSPSTSQNQSQAVNQQNPLE